MDPETMEKVAADGETLGEVMFRGNIVMKGYLKNETATEEAFAGGWFHSGDLGVHAPRRLHPAQGPLEGHHHLGRREHLIDRGRGRAVQAPGRRCRRGRRQAGREMGRDAVRFRRARPGATATEQTRSSAGAATTSPATNAHVTSCSSRCRRPRPARSRNSSCATWRKKSEAHAATPNSISSRAAAKRRSSASRHACRVRSAGTRATRSSPSIRRRK